MYYDPLDVPGCSVNNHLPGFSVLWKYVGSGNDPLRSNQNAVAFAEHVDEGRKIRFWNSIP